MASDEISIIPLFSERSDRSFTVHFAGHDIYTTVTRRPSNVRFWLYRTRCLHIHRFHRIIVGLGVQWRPTSGDRIPSTLQLSVCRRCLIFQLGRSRSTPNALRKFLENQEITFAAVGVGLGSRLLMREYDLRFANGVEIRHLAAGTMRRRNAAMADMAEEILGCRSETVMIAKDPEIGISSWDVLNLSHDQIIYASVDAYLSFMLGMQLI